MNRNVIPCFGARLVQAFPVLLKQAELMLTSGELNPRHQHCVTLYAKGLTCEADTLGSCGHVYISIYPTQR
ncbi:type IV toxin-antitoxin system YeeU family antitoxin [Klebsiella aerogenes]|uniref:type IV toxin-antitoxin system YeeU family antitoxin n=1 Tax=Klebsiella aerogenes TaxID=548 RepID=UPI001CFB2482|nr:type IV toxin-antitoxin system YeeU family antitoxin [Klebsiella aerogenes]